MNEIEALDNIQENFRSRSFSNDREVIEYLDRNYPRQVDEIVRLVEASVITTEQAGQLFERLWNDDVPDGLRGL